MIRFLITKINFTLYYLFVLILISCKSLNISDEHGLIEDNKYDSEFPTISVSKQLSYISSTVKKLDVLAFYSNYYFDIGSKIQRNMLSDSLLNSQLVSNNITHESVSGTASVIYSNNDIIGLLTCAHVVDFKDTVFSYYKSGNRGLRSVSIKIKQQNHVSGLVMGEPIEVIALDKKMDIAILKKKSITFAEKNNVLNFPIGNINDLQWGSLVYIMGYAAGNLMVTRAIVSISNKMKSGIFVTDALYNHGISGGAVFAMRDGAQNFEFVGMASSAAAQKSNILIADDDYKAGGAQNNQYFGRIFVDNNKLISYGVTYSVGINEIVNFILLNKSDLEDNGFNINYFFK